MKSIFTKDNKPDPPPRYSKTWIEKEITHLKKPRPVRNLTNVTMTTGRFSFISAVIILVLLYILDPVFYSFYKDDAIHAYLYLHSYGNDAVAQQLVQSGMLSQIDADKLNHTQGDFQGYFSSPEAARKEAEIILHFMGQVQALHGGQFSQLDLLQKIRYLLFIKTGLTPPIYWSSVTPTVADPGS